MNNLTDMEQVSKCYYPLFFLMAQEHELILTNEEMDEIIQTANKVQKSINDLPIPERD